MIWHHGHSQPCDSRGCHVPWIDDTLDWLNELGLDAMVLQMPGYQCNYDQADTAGWVPGNESSPKAQASHWCGNACLFWRHFHTYINDHFTQTGCGQTQGQVQHKAFSAGVAGAITPGGSVWRSRASQLANSLWSRSS